VSIINLSSDLSASDTVRTRDDEKRTKGTSESDTLPLTTRDALTRRIRARSFLYRSLDATLTGKVVGKVNAATNGRRAEHSRATCNVCFSSVHASTTARQPRGSRAVRSVLFLHRRLMRSRRDELLRAAGNTVACTGTPLDQSQRFPSSSVRYLGAT